ncbi:DUF6894 family protein [Agrobacterium pusense]|uniref:DUF6894 domain-containing protein n=1 Tax=Agrobacterium pusense TaxID=648995 RepID=A0AA44EH11_9HYPH|nr:hypothetical protein [Agrobacterium pusense]KAJ34363.1 hypothetical protein BW45_04350 [Agrobacterium tumefaciens]NRF10534.1 hypothetical protein [Agrobacterium pusense]NRF18561.1 hypothetical protein [Agrobacterium pusense]
MPRFFFSIVSGQHILDDDEGSDLASLDQAIEEAHKDARELMSEAILQGHDISDGCVVIRDSARELLKVVPFADALDRKP